MELQWNVSHVTATSQRSLQCLTTLLSASENWSYFTCLAEKIWKASIFHSKHLQKNWPQWKCSQTRNSEENREWKVFLIKYKYIVCYSVGIFLLKSVQEHSTLGLFSHHPHPRKACPPHSCCLAHSQGGQGRTECCTPSSSQETQEFLQPLCCSHRGSGHTSDILNPLQTDLSRMILFSLNLPNSYHSACIFTVQCSNGQGQVGVHGARTEPAGASPCWGVAKTSPLGMLGHGESRTFAQKWQTQMGFGQTESGAGFTFHINFCIKKYISEICYRQGQDYRVHNVNRLLSDFIFVKLLL